jgi:ribosomal protein S18 acetylase RimI-like enzyme
VGSEPVQSTESDVVIRRAAEEEVALVTEITDQAYQEYVALLGRAPQPMTVDYAPMIRAGQVWLLSAGGHVVGLLVLVQEPDGALIYSVAVRPEHQKKGYGRQLLDWAERETRRLGHSRIRLYTNALMGANAALYRSLGYNETRREPYRGSTLIHMSKTI